MDTQLKIIGTVRSAINRLEDCPRQEYENAPEALIELHTEYTTAMRDIKKGDDLIILTWLDKADRDVQETRPRNDPNAPLTGVFSTRSPDRPNPIGVHFVKVTDVSGHQLFIDKLEVLNNTPVVDIKIR